MATVTEDGWPCVQHRGGPPGFLKLLGHVRVFDAREHPQLADQLAPAPELRGKVERLFLIHVIGFDWNCPKYITPHYTQAEVEIAVAPLKQRIAELEARLKSRK